MVNQLSELWKQRDRPVVLGESGVGAGLGDGDNNSVLPGIGEVEVGKNFINKISI